jgi:hypothetical protein
VYEDKDNVFVEVEIPGMKKEEIEVVVRRVIRQSLQRCAIGVHTINVGRTVPLGGEGYPLSNR